MNVHFNEKFKRGFSLIELIMVITIISIVTGGVVAVMISNFTYANLDNDINGVVQSLRRAQANSISGFHDSKWGVAIDQVNKQYTLFSGDTYALRDIAYDLVSDLNTNNFFAEILLNGSGSEVVFNRATGDTSQYGSIKIQENSGSNYTITINKLGQININ